MQGYEGTIYFIRFYQANVEDVSDFIFSWGWLIFGLPIPIILPTTFFNMMFAIKMYGSIGILLIALGRKKFVLVSIILLFLAFGSLEYERITTNDFRTRDELIKFLKNDPTDRMTYTQDFNCEDFSRTLIQSASKVGYRLNFHTFSNHALCKAYVISENMWFEIEPQTDGIKTSQIDLMKVYIIIFSFPVVYMILTIYEKISKRLHLGRYRNG